MKSFSVFVSFLVFFPSLLASSDITYIAPNSISDLPPHVISALEKEKCLVPKWSYQFGGVTKGEFARPGQRDVAVICTRNNHSRILMFWGGPAGGPSEMDSIGQFISTVDKRYILEHFAAYGGNKPPKITHQAINDHYLEKASIVKYCHQGGWIELTGAD